MTVGGIQILIMADGGIQILIMAVGVIQILNNGSRKNSIHIMAVGGIQILNTHCQVIYNLVMFVFLIVIRCLL